eukprot:GFKZ01012406.1.p2 GENE.GFKZ01012406.1~~GFKZ01012406.1.p2  ORF type:complete len:366 (-),score=49.46 GFKZ01012406.1:2500-3597(-)
MFQHEVEVDVRDREDVGERPEGVGSGRAVLVTLADWHFQGCARNVFRSARKFGWRLPMILLATDYEAFDKGIVEELEELGVMIVHTQATLDGWLRKGVENFDVYREMDIRKFRKMEVFLNPIFRTYERIVFVDADGIIDGSLEPLINVGFPENVTLLMRQNDLSMGKGGLWANEIAVEVLTDRQMRLLAERYPNRAMTGGSCWFLVNVRRLESPRVLLERSLEILCTFRAGFRFNDQTLISLLFYTEIKLFPWCVWDEVRVMTGVEELRSYCKRNMHLQRWLNGRLRFMYRHMSPMEKRSCISSDIPRRTRHQNESADGGGNGGLKQVESERNTVYRGDEGKEAFSVEAECIRALQKWRNKLPEK